MTLDTMNTLKALADECLRRDVEGIPSQATREDVINALLVLTHTADSFQFHRGDFDLNNTTFHIIQTRSEASGMALRQWCIDHVGFDPAEGAP